MKLERCPGAGGDRAQSDARRPVPTWPRRLAEVDDASTRLSELLVEARAMAAGGSPALIRRLAVQVRSLHQRRPNPSGDRRRDGQRRRGAPAAAAPARRLATFRRRGFRPGVLPAGTGRRARPSELPERDRSGRGRSAAAGHALDPRRIDIYQLGTLLCRLLTGESVLAYMYDPTVKAQVPAAARSLLDRALGHDARAV